MSLDGIFIHALTDELDNTLTGGQVNRIDQPYDNETILTIRANRKNYKLLLSAHPQYARVQLTNISYENPAQPPQFCMVLRKYLNRARLVEIKQIENDRILAFYFSNRNELGDDTHFILYAEIMGRHSNVLLVDEKENKIIEALRHVPSSQNSYRTLLPGAPFVPAPSQEKLNPFDASAETLDSAIKAIDNDHLEKQIQGAVQGIGRDTAQELVIHCEKSEDSAGKVIHNFLHKIDNDLKPTLYEDGTKSYLTPVEYDLYKDTDENFTYETLSELMDNYFGEKAERNHVHQMSKEIEQFLTNELDKGQKKLAKQESEVKATAKADDFRIKGEVLTAYMHQVKQGDTEVTLPNFYDNESELTIVLDPQKSPAQNAQKLFNRYQKLKSRKQSLTKHIETTKDTNDYLESTLTQLEIASPSDIPEIREELIEEGYIKQKQSKRKKKTKKAKPRQFKSSDGDTILIGRNNKQNDELTLRKANKSHIWLHTKDIPGSHVIIQSDNPSEDTILEAADLAAYYSKARMSNNVPVDYVEVKHVHKPNGAKPGFVIYEGQQTVFATPSKHTVKKLASE